MPSRSRTNCYRWLEWPPGASVADVDTAYLRLARQYLRAGRKAELAALRDKERNREERIEHYWKLRGLIKKYGCENGVYADEGGFEAEPACPYARSKLKRARM